MVTIRLARHGAKGSPFYHVAVADRAAKRDGRFIERVGFFNPVARGKAERLRIDLERVDYWLSVGAIPSERVSRLLIEARKLASEAPAGGETKTQAANTEAAAERAASELAGEPEARAEATTETATDTDEGADAADETAAAEQGSEKAD